MRAHFGYKDSSSLATISQGTDPAGVGPVTLRAHSQQHQEESKTLQLRLLPFRDTQGNAHFNTTSQHLQPGNYLALCDYAP